jgi:hypothetical protein
VTILRERAEPRSPVFQVVSSFLIPNLQEVPLDHRYETTSRRLVRLASTALLEQAQTGSLPEPDRLPAGDLVDAVTDGRVMLSPEPDGAVAISFPGAGDHQKARPSRPDTAPRAFPFEIHLPP